MTLYRDGRPLLIDVGVETYSKKTFSPQRYEIWTMQSCWHNLPQFDPDGAKYDQQPGAAFAAADVTVTDALDGLAMDLARLRQCAGAGAVTAAAYSPDRYRPDLAR